jgi:hypothetical protein
MPWTPQPIDMGLSHGFVEFSNYALNQRISIDIHKKRTKILFDDVNSLIIYYVSGKRRGKI